VQERVLDDRVDLRTRREIETRRRRYDSGAFIAIGLKRQ
jgi:hypothetical protein